MSISSVSACPSLRVLLLEDEVLIAYLIDELLHDFGHAVVAECTRVDDALEALMCVDCDFAVLDLSIRGVFCYPLAHALRARGIPFVFVTGCDPSSVDTLFRDVPVVEKPFFPRDFQDAIGRACSPGESLHKH